MTGELTGRLKEQYEASLGDTYREKRKAELVDIIILPARDVGKVQLQTGDDFY